MKRLRRTICLVIGITICLSAMPVSHAASSDGASVPISDGTGHTLAIMADGSLWTWGGNDSGQLGDGTFTDRLKPAKVMDNVAMFAKYQSSTLAVKTDGTLWTWGSNYRGQLGDGTTTKRNYPVKIMDNVASATIEMGSVMAVGTDGSLWAWGENWTGQLGDGTAEERHSPVKIMDNVKMVEWDGASAMAIKTDGTLWTWGRNSDGCLGNGTTRYSLSPVQILDNVATASGTTAIKTDGSLWAWGSNDYGQLGDGTTTDRLSPVKIMDNVASVSKHVGYMMAIKRDGTLWSWGSNEYGQLGNGAGGKLHDYSAAPKKIMDGVKAVHLERLYALAIKNDDTLWAWGRNDCGELGDGTTTHRLSPVKITDNVASVYTSEVYAAEMSAFTMALKKDGSFWAWGGDYSVVTQNGSSKAIRTGGDYWKDFQPSPVKVMDNVAWAMTDFLYTYIAQTDGSLWGWGVNAGRFGDVPPGHKQTPVKILNGIKISTAPAEPDEPSGWAAPDVSEAVSLDLVPESLQSRYKYTATRAEFCALAVALYEKAAGEEITARQAFTDTTDSNVEKMAAIGVVNGVSPGVFAPNASLTREQAAAMLARLANAIGEPLPVEATSFSDKGSISDWALEAVGQVQAAGIMNGTRPDTFTPRGPYTREQSIVTLLRMYEAICGNT